MSSTETPILGPCEAWVTVDEVAECCNASIGSDTSVFEFAASAASQILYELSGEQFPGECGPTTERPFANQGACGCWQNILYPLSPGAPQLQLSWGWWGPLGWGWGYEGCTELVSCGALSRAKLAGYPVTEILEVTIDGVVVDPDGYRLDKYMWLTRLADPVTLAPRFWPSCQRLDLDLGQPGTWGVTFMFGYAPPLAGVRAAAELACQIYKACNGESCDLPAGTVQIDRQGMSIKRNPALAWAQIKGVWQTGLPLVDMFLSAYNPAGLERPSTVWSPDLQPYSQRMGNE